MADALEFILNGDSVRVYNCSPNTTLLEYLRSRGLTGSKEGCAEGDCGACSVALLARDSLGRPAYRAINSCLVPISLLAGREIISVEGVAPKFCVANSVSKRSDQKASPSTLHPVQQMMVDCNGSQCGYCTPGFILSLFEGYYRGDIRTPDQLDDQLSGNLCRCTGYRPIRDAAMLAFPARHQKNGQDLFAERLKKPVPALAEIKYEYAGEKFFRPVSLSGLLKLLERFPDARLIAGATELGLDITKRFEKFPILISTEAVPELREIRSDEKDWHIGAAVTLTEVEDKMGHEFPALADMLRVFGSRQIRNRATMGGNIVTASPIGDSAPVLLALNASVVLVSLQKRERTVAMSDFFVAYRKTALQPNEILKTIMVPRFDSQPALRRICHWYKVSKRREMDISTVAACFCIDLDTQDIVRHCRMAYGGVAAMPACARKTEQSLIGERWCEDTVRRLLPILQNEFTPISDVRGSAEYRRGLITSLFEKFCFDTAGKPLGTRSAAKLSVLAPTLAANTASSSLPHESAHKHVTGEALYPDDQLSAKHALEVWPICSPHARGKILIRDARAARTMPGIKAVLLAEDVPGLNDVGTKHDEMLLARDEVFYHGQIVALVVGESQEACRAAADKVIVEYKPLAPILSLPQAIAARSFHNEPNFIRRGNIDKALAAAPFSLNGQFELGGQEHFYLETHAAWAEPDEDGSLLVTSSTQHPSEVQMVVAHLLGQPINKVVIQCPRMGGGFGGKETQAAMPAAIAALAAHLTRLRVRVRFNRDQDMILTGHRHPFLAHFQIGFNNRGQLLAARVHLTSNGGWALDLSQAVTDRALFHLDNAYYIPSVEFRGQVAKTNLSSNTAFRGFGGPQGMLVIEEILDRVARRLGLPPEVVRERNLYRGKGETNTTHYGQTLEDNRIQTIWRELKKSSSYVRRRKEISKWNEDNPCQKRGLAITPVKFGISFTVTHLNQAGAFALIYQDGTVQVNHGGTEMGQGVHTNIQQIAAAEFGISTDHVRVMTTSTDKVPNTSATAASCGTDLNGAAVKNACEILRKRLLPIAATLLKDKLDTSRQPSPNEIVFANARVFCRGRPRTFLSFTEVVRKAYFQRTSLSATGYYATPGIHWDRVAGRGKPFHYFACGAAVTEVEVDGFTGMHRVLRVDILHDVGNSINENINRGQIEGGFVQGMGWLTTEELKWDDHGKLLTHSPDTYKIPSVGDTPLVFNVTFLKNAAQKNTIAGSKAVGEPPLMLAISVREAIRDAIAAFDPVGGEVLLASPATCEAIFIATQRRLQSRALPLALDSTQPVSR